METWGGRNDLYLKGKITVCKKEIIDKKGVKGKKRKRDSQKLSFYRALD